MILRPQLSDFKQIFYYLGKIILGLGLTMFIPFLLGLLVFKEVQPALDFLISAELTVMLGLFLTSVCRSDKELSMLQGMVVVALSWLAAMVLSAIPLLFSGHFNSFLDACFETMSGFTTTGLSLAQDLDHLSYTHNLWRHFGPFLGGQGITIIALALFVKGSAGNISMYLAEARDEKILPNIINTSRFIWLFSIFYLFTGTLVLGLAGLKIGLTPFNAFFHGACIFMAGFDTAGFSPQSQNILYYHSGLYEIITIIFMIIGSLNFNLHYQLYIKNRKEIFKNIETILFSVSVTVLFLIISFDLIRSNTYAQPLILFRKGFYTLISAHTTTGYMTVYAQQFIKEWGPLALLGIIIAMGLGGSACSTAGGIKMLRIGVILAALKEDIKTILLPPHAVIKERFHHIKTLFIDDKLVRASFTITFAYLVCYFVGMLIGVGCGYPVLNSLFESTSAAGNVGLSCGITDTAMPAILKITYIVQMWAGRLEFMAIFALFGFAGALVKGK